MSKKDLEHNPEKVKVCKIDVPIWEKLNLTVKEAAAYSNIGINRIELMLQDPNCNFCLKVGNKRLVKRKAFNDFIENVNIL